MVASVYLVLQASIFGVEYSREVLASSSAPNQVARVAHVFEVKLQMGLGEPRLVVDLHICVDGPHLHVEPGSWLAIACGGPLSSLISHDHLKRRLRLAVVS